jgi:hypothetical protein
VEVLNSIKAEDVALAMSLLTKLIKTNRPDPSSFVADLSQAFADVRADAYREALQDAGKLAGLGAG